MPGKQAGEDFVLIANLLVCAVRKLSNSLAIASAPEQRQSLRGIDRQRFQQHGVNQAEDRRIGPDAQRQRERGHACKAGMLHQHPRAITQVLKHFVLQSYWLRRSVSSWSQSICTFAPHHVVRRLELREATWERLDPI